MSQPLPQIVSASTLQPLAAPDESLAVRIILLTTSGSTTFTVRGVKRKYLLTRDGMVGRHVLDIPVSLWNQGIPSSHYRDNQSLAHDLMSRPQPLVPFITMLVPWRGAAAKPAITPPSASNQGDPPKPDFIPVLRRLMGKLGAPAVVRDAFDLVQNGCTLAELESLVESVPQDTGDPVDSDTGKPEGKLEKSSKPETPAAKRMREKRARDKAAKLLSQSP